MRIHIYKFPPKRSNTHANGRCFTTRASSCLSVVVQIKYPENFFLLRGNHECASINRIYGFYDECKRRYNIRLWKTFTDCFNCLPVAALVDEKVGSHAPQLHQQGCHQQGCSGTCILPQCLHSLLFVGRPRSVPARGVFSLWAVGTPWML